ncbi:OmcA/MtrC family decaheme c-type cytochrome [Shewanella sp. 10N.286.48.A6]|uniref:OmcA/MtrC family decaheme c-type cytochrome n=1 Tax=Shewanella sp. 10N.286.48.A6 TaxID=1880833 RepID=UPI000C81F12D|nr:OmcA/MtrC family decaheme c-type cytochrome [Shewanella sp. 10N.286.48.A6]PMI01716.1 cytochrome C [Shewanella sp. 10N.286.48.A6]
MMNKFNLNTTAKAVFSAGLLAFALTGCGSDGSDGKDGEDGQDGPVGVDIKSATSLNAQITHAAIADGIVTVDFSLENANGVAVTGLEEFADINTLGFGIAKLDALQKRLLVDTTAPDEPASRKGTKPMQWTSYINSVQAPNLDHVPPGFEALATDQIQANIEGTCKVECITKLATGEYRYTFSKALSEYDQIDGLNTEYNAELVHRITLELRPTSTTQNATLINTHFDFVPALDREATAEETRNLVNLQESCIRCHSDNYENEDELAPKLAMHGTKRTEIENCVVCHTSYSGDPETQATLDFGSMLHRIHQGTYVMAGYGGSVHDYTDVTFPAGDGCQSCHIQGEDAPAQADNFYYHRQEACASCHMAEFNPVDQKAWFTPPENQKDRGFVGNYFHYYATPEIDGVPGADVKSHFDAGDCSACHADDSNPMGAAKFHTAKATETINVRDAYAYELSNGIYDADSQTLEFTLVWNQDKMPNEDNSIQSFWLNVSPFNGVEYEISSSTTPDRLSINLAELNGVQEGNSISYTLTGIDTTQITNLKQGFIDGKLAVCAQAPDQTPEAASLIDCETMDESNANFTVYVGSNKASFSEDGNDIDQRIVVVSEAKCANCHEKQADFSISHSYTRNTGTPDSGCARCHSPNPNTAVKLADGSCVACHNGAQNHKTTDPKFEFDRSFDFKVMAHQIHANKRGGRFGDKVNSITYPGQYADCAECHDKGQLTLSKVNQKATVSYEGEYSPTVAACASCHAPTADGKEAAVQHFIANGGVYQGTAGEYVPGSESCATCHAEGKAFGVDTVHPVNYK